MSDDQLAASLEIEPGAVKKGPPCSVASALARLSTRVPKSAERLLELVDDDQVPPRWLAERFVAAGEPMKDYTIRRHRRRGHANGCGCST